MQVILFLIVVKEFILTPLPFATTLLTHAFMSINYPFISCEHPQRYFNKYLGTELTTRCRKCYACLNQKNFSNKSLIDVHSQSYKYCAFITLTFNQSSIPLADIYQDDNGITYLVNQHGEILSSTNKMSKDDINKLQQKVYNNKGFYHFEYGKIPVLDYSYLRSFLVSLRQAIKQKRMRQYLSMSERKKLKKQYILVDNPYISYETFTHYSCGEYGPNSFRPHFHLLLFFQDRSTLEAIRYHLPKVWKHGNADFQLTNGNASTYLASYASANTCLPSIYQGFQICAKSRHSIYFGFNTFEDFKETLYEERSNFSDTFDIQINGRTKSKSFTTSYKTFLFPKCQSYLYIPVDIAFKRYTLAKDLLSEIKSLIGTDFPLSTSSLVKFISDHKSFPFRTLKHCGYDVTNIDFIGNDKTKTQLSTLSSALRVSIRFIQNALSLHLSYSEYFKVINDFWSNQQSLNYRRFLSKLESFSKDNPAFDIESVYDDTLELSSSFINTNFYRSFITYHHTLHQNTIKHKSLNDSNNLIYNF